VGAIGVFELFAEEIVKFGDFVQVLIAESVEEGANLGIFGFIESPCEFADVEFESDAEGIGSIADSVSSLFEETEAEFSLGF
jgi:hypothetical protein